MSKRLGIDLGSDSILIYSDKDGLIVNDASVVAIDNETKNIIAVGKKASAMVGRTPGKIKAIRPIKNSIIDDFSLTEGLISNLLKENNYTSSLTRPTIVLTFPSNITKVEKNAIKELGEVLGAKKVILEEKPKIAALGIGMDIDKPLANMVVDIGRGTTEIAIISLNDIVISNSIKTAGKTFNEDIKKYIKLKYKLLIGSQTAENIKRKIGCVYKIEKGETLEVKGRNLITGLPNSIEITSKEVKEAIEDSVHLIIKNIKSILETTPPELSADIVDKGLVLTGGSAQLKGIADLFEDELNIPILIANEPTTSIAEGFKKYFEINKR
ncbi:MAG: rod shape-determining protein [Bacilli bacterium]